MHASNKNIKRRYYLVFAVWIIGTLVAASYFISGRLIEFDPSARLSGKSNATVMKQLSNIEQLKNIDLSNTIIHFTSDNCFCTEYSEDHKKQINQQAGVDGFKVVNVHLPDKFSNIIPSTPAILLVSKSKDLLYFGPYSVGLACTQSNGYVETILQNYKKGFASSIILKEASGCYCNLE